MSTFFDAHFHAMSIGHPNFIAFMHEVESNFSEEVISGMFSPNYLMSHKGQTAFAARIQNILAVMERPIGEIFALMEKDLSTQMEISPSWSILQQQKKKTYRDPFITEGALHMRDRTYDRIGMCPMIMDFTQTEEILHGVYDHTHTADRLIEYVEDTRNGILHYERIYPDGLFSFYPFLGINPAEHEQSFIEDLFSTYLISELEDRRAHRLKDSRFCYGVKLYPPLGFDPWPEDSREREKNAYIYGLCSEKRIPITTHCDDQGFRTVAAKKAWEYTSPRRWEAVLEQFPDLIIDFAHFGKQYRPGASVANRASSLKMTSKLLNQVIDSWSTKIIELMHRYEHVYADFSFSGSTPGFYKQLLDYTNSCSLDQQKSLCGRMMFGTDYFVNLSKVDSYSHFYHLYESSPFSDEQIHRFGSVNPASWLQL